MLFGYCMSLFILEVSLVFVRINCIGLLGLHHLFYKGAAGPLGLQGCAASPGAGPLGLQGCGPLGLQLCASPDAATPSAASPGTGPRGYPPPYKCNPSPIDRIIQFHSYFSPLTI
jgi:hypothetical protein